MARLVVQLFTVLVMCSASASACRSAQRSLQRAQRAQQQSDIVPLLQDAFTFWLKYGPDKQYGGFHGTLDRQGNPMNPTNKMIVQQSRHLWAFSSLLMAKPETWGFKSSEVRAAADTAYKFMRDNMLRDVDGGKLFVYEAARNGKVANSSINTYGNAFAIYGLATYAQATGSAEARALALNTFKTLDRLYHSPATGGYDESTADFSLDSIPLRPAASGSGSSSSNVVTEAGAAAAYRTGKGKGRLSQSFNNLLHLAEALTELSKATGGSDPLVTARLLELLQLQTGPLVIRPNKAGPNTPSAYIGPNYDPRNWSPVGSAYSNYGHNIEAAWLLADGVDELQAKGAIDTSKAAAMRKALQEIGEAAIVAGYDEKNGGIHDGSNVGAASPTSPNKVWWAQAEALLGFDWLHKQTGKVVHKARFAQTLNFIKNHLWDKQYGEWYWQTAPAGGAPLAYNAGDVDFAPTVKSNAWKASYHTGRALLRLAQAGY